MYFYTKLKIVKIKILSSNYFFFKKLIQFCNHFISPSIITNQLTILRSPHVFKKSREQFAKKLLKLQTFYYLKKNDINLIKNYLFLTFFFKIWKKNLYLIKSYTIKLKFKTNF